MFSARLLDELVFVICCSYCRRNSPSLLSATTTIHPNSSAIKAMAVAGTPLSPKSQHDLNMVMPMPPPLLHTRSGNELYDRPQTPTTPAGNHGFTSPVQTPQGSPSKKQLPPGANDLPNVFENAMKLAPMSPTKSQPKSPSKQGLYAGDDNVRKDPFTDAQTHHLGRSESPTRQSNKENAPALRYGKDIQQNQAALSRQEPYQPTESRKTITRGLTTEELQKLQLPKVKRLANVTQLCKSHLLWSSPFRD